MKNWQKNRIQDTKNAINNMIANIEKMKKVSCFLSQEVVQFDGKVWNKKIEHTLNKKIYDMCKGYILTEYKGGIFSLDIHLSYGKMPYELFTVYKSKDKALYTQAGNYRINAQNWQSQADAYCGVCDVTIESFKNDLDNLDTFVEKYNALLDELENLPNSLQIETRNIIRQTSLFYAPIPSLF